MKKKIISCYVVNRLRMIRYVIPSKMSLFV